MSVSRHHLLFRDGLAINMEDTAAPGLGPRDRGAYGLQTKMRLCHSGLWNVGIAESLESRQYANLALSNNLWYQVFVFEDVK